MQRYGEWLMINVLFIHSSSELYGSDRSLLNIVKNINKNKFKVFVLLPCDGPLAVEMKKLKYVQVENYEVAVLRRKNLSFHGGIQYLKEFHESVKFITHFIEMHNIDIVDTNTAVVFPGAVAAKKEKIKSVWHIREIIENNIENKVISFMMNRYADLIVANSKSTGKALNVSQNKVRVVYNAVDESYNNGLIKHDGFVVGMAGRINRWKGQKLFVDAAEIVHKTKPEVKFLIAGDVYKGEDFLKEDLIHYIDKKMLNGVVSLLGQVNDMPSFYKGLDIFVLPSIQPEPFGLVVIEAMEYGIPVVATNHGGPVEIIDDGFNGYLVDYKNAEEMAERILFLARNEGVRKKVGNNGKREKRDKFSVESMTHEVENAFSEVMGIE